MTKAKPIRLTHKGKKYVIIPERQSGEASNKFADKQHSALPAGKRTVTDKKGRKKTYTETRKNRSDKGKFI